MNFQEIIAVVEITCPGQSPQIRRVDVMQIAGRFDSGTALNVVGQNNPGCKVRLVDVEWVVNKK